MKKKSVRMVALAMIVAMMATCFAGCGKKTCELCGKEKKCKTFTMDGEKVTLCEDCDAIAELYNAFK